MTTKIATVGFSVQQVPKPSGIVPAGYMVWLTESNVTQDVANIGPDDRTAQFTITQPGVYTAHVVRMDTNGGSIGSSASSEPFIVTEDMVEVPLLVTVNVADAVALPRNVKARVR
jgi:hypothetical protein